MLPIRMAITPLNTAVYRGLHVVIAELLKRGSTRYNGRDNRTYNCDMTSL